MRANPILRPQGDPQKDTKIEVEHNELKWAKWIQWVKMNTTIVTVERRYRLAHTRI